MVHVVVGIILNAERKILIAQRLAHQEKGGCWEFPGGKVEENESAFLALQRELNEELKIQVQSATPWLQVTYDYPHKSVLLDTWLVSQFDGDPIGAEGQPVRWVSFDELAQFEFPEGNRKIIDKLLEEFA